MKLTYSQKRRLGWIFSNSQTRRWLTQGFEMKRLWKERIRPHNRCLDAGCGGGTYAIEHFLAKDASCHLVDLSEKNLKVARRQVDEARCSARASFFQGPLEELPLESGPFDRIQCLEVLEHLVDPSGILKTLHKLSSSESLLMVSVPHPPEWFPNSSHVKEGYTEDELRALLFSTGWDIFEVQYCMLISTRLFKWFEMHGFPLHGLNWLLVLENFVPRRVRRHLLPYDIVVIAKRIEPKHQSTP